ncbi:MAG: universal stress protein [Bacteroidales bacterium]|nr:universal stress protein [Bacteroidales bacterium]
METQVNNIILVPTDFTAVTENAIHQACQTAKIIKSKVCLLHIIDSATKSNLKKEQLDSDSIDARLKTMAAEFASLHQVEVETLTREGSIFTEIADVAKEIGAKLLFLGTHGKTNLEQKLTGSYALKVVTKSPAPVVVVQKRAIDGVYRKIVLPITSDAGPWEKTKWATYIAQNLKSVIHIYQLPGEAIAEAVKTITGHFDKNRVSYVVKVAEKSGDFSKQVIEYSTANNADMVMIMTNPDKGLSTFILGSYDEEMIFNAPQIPVMCINPRDFNWAKIVDY